MPRLWTQQSDLPLRLVHIRNIDVPSHTRISDDLVLVIRTRSRNSKQLIRQFRARGDTSIQFLPCTSAEGVIVACGEGRIVTCDFVNKHFTFDVSADGLTFDDLEDVQIRIISRHAARRQRFLAVAEEVLPDLRVPQRYHVRVGAVDTATGLVDSEDGDGLVGAGGVAFGKVRVQAFGAEGYEDVDCMVSACASVLYVRSKAGWFNDCLGEWG